MLDLDSVLQIGKSVRVNFGEGNTRNQTRHIRAIVDDDHIVYRVWSKSKQRWIYHIAQRYEFEIIQEYLEKV